MPDAHCALTLQMSIKDILLILAAILTMVMTLGSHQTHKRNRK